MPGLDQVIETVAAGEGLRFSLAYLSLALFALVLVGFYAWFIPKGAGERNPRRPSRKSTPARRSPAAARGASNRRAICKI